MNGSSAGASPGTTAIPPGGSASSSSAFARATFSTLPSCSRCDGRDRRDDADVRARDLRESADLPRAAHAHLGDDDLGVGLDAGERERQPDLVVEAGFGGDEPNVRAQQRGEDVLRRGLPDRAGDRDDARAAARAHGAADRRERPNASSGTSVAAAPRARASSRNATPRRRRRRDRPAPRAASRSRRRSPPPRRPRPARGRRSSSTGSGIRCVLPACGARREPIRDRRTAPCDRRTPGPARRPCPRSARRRRRARARSRCAIARARSGSTSTAPVAPATIASMIACGSSLRGLSFVTIDDVGQLGRDARPSADASRDRGRPRSRTRRSPCPRRARARPEQRLERERLVRVVDDHLERLALVDRLETAGNAANRLEPTRDRALVDAEEPCRRERAECVLHVEAATELESMPSSASGPTSASSAKPNVSASGSSAASRRPYSSPMFTAAGGLPARRRGDASPA